MPMFQTQELCKSLEMQDIANESIKADWDGCLHMVTLRRHEPTINILYPVIVL